MLHQEMNDDKNRLFLIFINPIINEMNQLNLDFHSDSVDSGSLYDKMYQTLNSTCAKVFTPAAMNCLKNVEDISDDIIIEETMLLPTSAVDFGSEFESELINSKLEIVEKTMLKETCFQYFINWNKLPFTDWNA